MATLGLVEDGEDKK